MIPSCFSLPPEHEQYKAEILILRELMRSRPDFNSCAFFSAAFEFALVNGESLVLAGIVKRAALEALKGVLARRVLEASCKTEAELTN